MLRTTLAVVLLSAAQNAASLSLEAQQQNPARIPRDDLRALVNADLDAGIYDIVPGRDGECTLRYVRQKLNRYYRGLYACNDK